MKTYTVLCFYRQDPGMNYSQWTHSDTVTVQATDANEARVNAIIAMYAKHNNNCSHVHTSAPKEYPNV